MVFGLNDWAIPDPLFEALRKDGPHMSDQSFDGLSEDELASLLESSTQRSDESATEWASRAAQEAAAGYAKAKAAREASNVEAEPETPTE